MAIKVNCPHCDQAYTLVDEQAGKKVRCKTCTTVFEVPAPGEGRQEAGASDAPRRGRPDEHDDRDEEDRPRRRGRGRRAGIPVWVWPVIGGVVLFVLTLVGGIVFLVATGTLGTKVTQENFNKLQMGMTETQVKAILGTPTEVTDLGGFFGNNPLFAGAGLRQLVWKHGQNQISVTFSGDRVTSLSGSFVTK